LNSNTICKDFNEKYSELYRLIIKKKNRLSESLNRLQYQPSNKGIENLKAVLRINSSELKLFDSLLNLKVREDLNFKKKEKQVILLQKIFTNKDKFNKLSDDKKDLLKTLLGKYSKGLDSRSSNQEQQVIMKSLNEFSDTFYKANKSTPRIDFVKCEEKFYKYGSLKVLIFIEMNILKGKITHLSS
jgi:hypothetical protein